MADLQYVADFETTTDLNDCRVWAWAVCEVGFTELVGLGNDIDSFIKFCIENNGVYYFHNLAFDGEFILSYLLNHGFTYSDKSKSKTFKTLISNTGKFYQMKVVFERHGNKKMNACTFKDSLKKLPMSVASIAKTFDLPMHKLEIDYNETRPVGHELTKKEVDYIANDVGIVSLALHHQFETGLEKLTIGSDALNWYKSTIDFNWDKMFPTLTLEMDANIRLAYKGGWTYANPKYTSDKSRPDYVNGAGSVYDVNSLYPDVMYNCPMPYGKPVWFRGKYKEDAEYPLYIMFVTCAVKLKKNHLPMLQIKRNPFFIETEYITDSKGYVELALTIVDWQLLTDHYNVDVYSYNGGYKFHSITGLFTKYINYWMHVKKTSTGGARMLAKLMLNSCYGKFATNPDVTPKIPYLKENGVVGYMLGDHEERKPVYTPIGCFITAWARNKTIRAAQAVYDRFLYADTDSIHVLGTEPVENIEVHPVNLGAWKHESNFDKSKYLRAKTYIEHITSVGKMVDDSYQMIDVDPYNDVKCAGMPKNLKEYVTFDNFKRGLTLDGKLLPKHVPGGIVLVPHTFTLL